MEQSFFNGGAKRILLSFAEEQYERIFPRLSASDEDPKRDLGSDRSEEEEKKMNAAALTALKEERERKNVAVFVVSERKILKKSKFLD